MVWCAATVSMASPVCLVDNGPDGCMRVQQEALQILEQIQQPVVVVAVVGLYRTGKSYLMNRLAGKHTGFALGSTIESKTKGIWMWCVPHPSEQGHTLVLLDTEGLGDVEKGDEQHDTWIFCLAVLLSSTLVYNSMGTIDNNALEKLQYVTELTEHIKVKSSEYEQSTELMRVFPSFVWTVRDFTLELILNGKPVTANQYLENALKLKPGHSVEVMKHNQVRQGLRDFFAERCCFVFERPASREKMRHMEELTDADLDPDFVEAAQKFCSYIFNSSKPKTMRGGLGVTGRMLGSLAETYVQAIRSGQVPCLESAVESLALIQNSRAVEEALEFYQREMERWVQLPTETQEALSDFHAAAEEQAISMFINASFNDHEHKYQLELMKSVCERFGEWRLANEQESRRVCERVLRRVFARLERMLRDGSFMRPGGYALYTAALLEAAQHYRAEKRKGLMSEEVLGEFLKGKEALGRSILQADQHISAAEKERQGCVVRAAEEARRVRSLEEARERQEQQQRDEERSFRRHMEKLQEKMETQQRRAQQERHTLLNAKLQEQRDLLERGYAEKVQVLEEEVAALRREACQGEESVTKGSALSNALEVLGTAAVVFMPGVGKVVGVGLSALSRLV